MFELQRSSLFFEQMASAHPTITQNIEIVYENKIALDRSYHQPKHFILELNNLLRSLLFFVELSKKNSPKWLKNSVESYISNNEDEYQTLRYLRNVSAHQKLIIPEESLVSGLYRIQSSKDYKLKLGYGDHEKPGNYAWDLALKDTSEIFHDMLTFSSIAFMDPEHSSIGECLGITRRWFFKIKFRTDTKRYNEVTDVHKLASIFSASLLDHVCQAYAEHIQVQFNHTFKQKLSDYNYINTLLEIDIFPSLFSDWWESKCEPLNMGVRSNISEGKKHTSSDNLHRWISENLTPDIAAYKSTLIRFAKLKPNEIFDSENLGDFISFILTNHWHYKKVFGGGLSQSTITPSDVMHLQRKGNILIEEFQKEKLCTIMSTKEDLNKHIKNLIEKIEAQESES